MHQNAAQAEVSRKAGEFTPCSMTLSVIKFVYCVVDLAVKSVRVSGSRTYLKVLKWASRDTSHGISHTPRTLPLEGPGSRVPSTTQFINVFIYELESECFEKGLSEARRRRERASFQ